MKFSKHFENSIPFEKREDVLKKIVQFEKDLKVFVTANGRSETDLIFKNNEEDKFASRRIEIKFILKNEEAINTISKALKKQ